MYPEEAYLQLSGIQHYAFCPRQWALIHIEGQWNENYLTATGRVMHNKAHSGNAAEKRGDQLIFRTLKVRSCELGISGECDVVEFHQAESGISLHGYGGLWTPYPVEYKRGKPKANHCDRLQLCAQAVCLEEMLCTRIACGALFYGETRRREVVTFTEELRKELADTVRAMHSLFSRRHTPRAAKGASCKGCSMKDLCLPALGAAGTASVLGYLEGYLE